MHLGDKIKESLLIYRTTTPNTKALTTTGSLAGRVRLAKATDYFGEVVGLVASFLSSFGPARLAHC